MARLTKQKLARVLSDSYFKHSAATLGNRAPTPADPLSRDLWLKMAGDAFKQIDRLVEDEVADALSVERARKR